LNGIVSRAVNLLSSREWYDMTAGLSVLTGRRSREMLKTADFPPKTAFSVIFSGALKRKGETTPITFEIPTLCQAKYILNGLSQLRTIVNNSQLSKG
ncbi:MAG: protelomerase family protein, partial [Cyanobacteria bacterium P01_F01_bin.3]